MHLDLSGPAPRIIMATSLVLMGGAALTVFMVPTPAPMAPTPVNLPVVYADSNRPVAEPVHRTACPTPEQKAAAFAALPDPIRLAHPDAHPETEADPGPPAEEAPGPREAMVRFHRMKARLDGAAEDAAWLAKALEQVAPGMGVRP